MKIQSIIRRAKGTTVKLGSNVYFFSSENDHTCDVTDEAHINRLLSIKDGFREAVAGTQNPPAKVKLGDVVAKEHTASSLSIDGNGDVDRDDLITSYVAKFGKNPHHAMKTETIAAKLAEADKQEG